MKTTIKQENYEFFLVIYLKDITGLIGVANPTGTQKLWGITHQNGHKRENDEFLVISLKTCKGSSKAGKSFRNPKNVGNSS